MTNSFEFIGIKDQRELSAQVVGWSTPILARSSIDDDYEEGQAIPIYYDPMIAKLVAWSAARDEAIDRLCRAIDEYYISGVSTTLTFGKWVMQHEAFISGKFDTGFIPKYFNPEKNKLQHDSREEEEVAALLAAFTFNGKAKQENGVVKQEPAKSNWQLNRRKLRG